MIIFNTIAVDHHVYLDMGFKPTTIWRVHNAHSTFDPLNSIYVPLTVHHLKKGISYFLRIFLLRLDFYYKRKLIEKLDFFSFLDDNIKNNLKEWDKIPAGKIGPSIPFITAPQEYPKTDFEGKLHLVIPGVNMDLRRKQFDVVADALQMLDLNHLHELKLTFFGKPVSSEAHKALNRILSLERNGLEIDWVKEVEQRVFDQKMMESHVILAPLRVNVLHRVYKEVYGSTKFSGSVADMIKYGKICIFPEAHYFDDELNHFVYKYYDNYSLKKIFITLLNVVNELDSKEFELRRFIKKNYSTEAFITKFESLFINTNG